MTQRALTVGVVGLGKVAQEHLKGYAGVDGISVIAGADPDADRTRDAEKSYGLKGYADYRDMLENEKLDIVSVLTPPALHLPVVKAAAAARRHILCEKPIAAAPEEVTAMKAAVAEADVKFLFGASYRHLPAMQRARQLIRDNTLGEIRLIVESAIGGHGAAETPRLSPVHYPVGGPGGTPTGLVDHGVHMIDAFPWLTVSAIETVYGSGNISGEDPHPEFAILTLANGAHCHLIYDEGTVSLAHPGEGVFTEGAGWNVRGFVPAGGWDLEPCTLNIYGAKGSLRIYPYANKLIRTGPDTGVREEQLPPLPAPNHFAAQMRSFVRSIINDEPLAASIEDGEQSLKAIFAIYKSASTRSAVNLN